MVEDESHAALSNLPNYLSDPLQRQDTATLRTVIAVCEDLIEKKEDEGVEEQRVEEEVGEDATIVDDPDEQKGVITKEYVKCGDENCACSSGAKDDKHGPYKYRYFRENGSLTSEYIGPG